MNISSIAQRLRNTKYEVTRLQDESGVLLNSKDLLVFTLNETGLFLLEAIEEGKAVSETDLVALLTSEFEVTEDQAQQDVREFIEDLGNAISSES